MIFEHTSYRSFLKGLLVERIQANPAYSLRAMARQLGFSGSQLSEAISGKANFSSSALQKIAKLLALTDSETEYLLLLGELEKQKDVELRESLFRRLQKINPKRRPIHDLSVDYFRQISEWYHSAILELVYVENFRFFPENIAKCLGISKAEAELALDRLLRLELISKDGKGKFHRENRDLQFKSVEKNAAMRKFYRQMLEKASRALDEQDPRERWSGYETIPVDPRALPEIRAAFNNCFEEVIRISRKYPRKKSVYHLLLHFFNLTNKGIL